MNFSKICGSVETKNIASAPPLICLLLMMDTLVYRAVCGTRCPSESLQVLSMCSALPAGTSPAGLMHAFPLTLRATLEVGEKGRQAGRGKERKNRRIPCHTAILPGSPLRFCGMAASPLQQEQ